MTEISIEIWLETWGSCPGGAAMEIFTACARVVQPGLHTLPLTNILSVATPLAATVK
jgi:hypothetical protein